MTDRSLSELVQQAEQLSSHMDEGVEELPRVDRSLTQILHSAQSLFAPDSGATSGTHDAQASILLGSRGLDLLHMSHRLESLSAAKGLEPIGGSSQDSDLASFLRNERHNAIIAAVEDTKRQTQREVEDLFWEQQKADWEQSKQKFMAAFTNVDADKLNVTSLPQDSLMSSLSVSLRGTNLTSMESSFARIVGECNAEILKGGMRSNLAEKMADAAKEMDDQGVNDFWALVVSLCEIPVSVGADGRGRDSNRVKTALVKQARTHLEKSYEKHMQNLVYSHLKSAHLGGIPGLMPLVKAYLNVGMPNINAAILEDGEVMGMSVWAMVFYCIRAGGYRAAVLALQDASSSPSELVPALEYLSQAENERLSPDLQKKVRMIYKRNAKAITDPFKRVVYCILGRCDPDEDHPEVIGTTDDYIWLKLTMVDVEENEESLAKGKYELLSLSRLQHLLYTQYGEKHFNAWQQPLLYTSVLLLTCQFEAGLEFLSRIDRLRCHAVHAALAFNQMNLVRLPEKNTAAPMLSSKDGDSAGSLRLNLVHLIRHYVRKFEMTNPLEALHYCYFLRNLKGEHDTIFIDCICDLVLQTREFNTLLGSLNEDGSRMPGIVDKFQVDVCEIAEIVAKDSEQKGLHEDAIKLYDLAKNHSKTLQLLNALVSQVVHVVPVGGSVVSQRDRVIQMAMLIATRLRTHGHNATPTHVATLHLLLDLSTFFDLVHANRYMEAIEVLERLQLIALRESEIESRVLSVSSLGLETKSVLPQVLVNAMNCLYKVHMSPQESSQVNVSFKGLNRSIQGGNTNKRIKEQSRSIVTFAGLIPMRMNADINAQLVQLEALIN